MAASMDEGRCKMIGCRNEQLEARSVGLLSGFFFNVNYIIGTGFLSVPYAFYRGGTLVVAVTLLLTSFVSWSSANWTVECMARAQAIFNFQEDKSSSSANCTTTSETSVNQKKPKFELLLTRKFEVSEMCEIFFGCYMKYIYLVIFCAQMLVSFWGSATVAGSAWASNLPLNFGSLSQCEEQAFHHNLAPSGGCLSAYRFCIMLFALIVIPLSLVELTEQKYLQILLGLMRFFTFGCLVVYSIANLITHPGHNPYNSTTTFNDSYTKYGNQITKFNFKGWLVALPIIVAIQILHQGIPSMTQPIKAKEWLRALYGTLFVTTTVLYLLIGVTMSLWFKGSIEETATLNFVRLAHHSPSTALRVMSYYIVLFPPLDVCSAYPLGVITLSNNLFVLLTGSDSTQVSRFKNGKLMLVALRLISAVLPLVGSLFITNLAYIAKYVGLMGLFICYFFPIMLQLRSQYVCHKMFSREAVSSSEPLSVSEELPLLADRRRKTGGLRWKQRTYYTPYSNVFSHPMIVIMFGIFSVVVCVLIIASLTVSH